MGYTFTKDELALTDKDIKVVANQRYMNGKQKQLLLVCFVSLAVLFGLSLINEVLGVLLSLVIFGGYFYRLFRSVKAYKDAFLDQYNANKG